MPNAVIARAQSKMATMASKLGKLRKPVQALLLNQSCVGLRLHWLRQNLDEQIVFDAFFSIHLNFLIYFKSSEIREKIRNRDENLPQKKFGFRFSFSFFEKIKFLSKIDLASIKTNWLAFKFSSERPTFAKLEILTGFNQTIMSF